MATANTRRNAEADDADLYVTQAEDVACLFHMLDKHGINLDTTRMIEPFAGRGDIAKYLERRGLTVVSTDLHDYGPWGYGTPGQDFFTLNLSDVTAIVTNPPYTVINDVLQYMGDSLPEKAVVAMLVRQSILETADRVKILQDYGGLRWVFQYAYRTLCPRIDPLTGQALYHTESEKAGKTVSTPAARAVAYCWVVFDYSYTGHPQIDWITKDVQYRAQREMSKLPPLQIIPGMCIGGGVAQHPQTAGPGLTLTRQVKTGE